MYKAPFICLCDKVIFPTDSSVIGMFPCQLRGSKHGALCWGVAGARGRVGIASCPMDAEQCCSPTSAPGPDRVRCVESMGLYQGGGMRLRHIPGNNQVLFTTEREV